jgi:CheY-specific phosphatase CheX
MSQMLGEPVDNLSNEISLSAIGEIANMITSNAAPRRGWRRAAFLVTSALRLSSDP